MPSEIDTLIFPVGNKLPADWFSGNAFLHPLIAKDKNNEFSVGSVTFEPGQEPTGISTKRTGFDCN